jgi:hypothetical protein
MDQGIEFISYTNAEYEYVEKLGGFRGFHVIRDPRDIVVSAYFSHLNSHPIDVWPELVEHRAELRTVSKEKGLLLEMDFCEKWFEHLYKWDYSLPNVLEVKYEELIQKPEHRFIEIFQFLGCMAREATPFSILNRGMNKIHKLIFGRQDANTISRQALLDIVCRNRFSKKAGGREPGEVDTHSHYRKGVAGDWVNHFTREHVAYFRSQYNHVLLKCGYDW